MNNQYSLFSCEKYSVFITGDPDSGKSSIIAKYAQNQNFTGTRICTGIPYKHLLISGLKIRIEFVKYIQFESNAYEIFTGLNDHFYPPASIFIVVFDKSNRKSFETIESWVEEYKRITNPRTCFMLVGNKCDLEPEVATDEGIEKALQYFMMYTETSIKTGKGINEMFEVVIRDQLSKKKSLWIDKFKNILS